MKIWIDYLRESPDDWLWLVNSEEAITMLDLLKSRDETIEVISFDHDLGGDDTSRRILIWIIENEYWPGEIRLHSMNPVGREWLQGTCNRYAPDWVKLAWND